MGHCSKFTNLIMEIVMEVAFFVYSYYLTIIEGDGFVMIYEYESLEVYTPE